MSSFIVHDKTISRVASWVADQRIDSSVTRKVAFAVSTLPHDPELPAKLGAAMFQLNCEAVNQRYGPDEAAQFRALDYKYQHELSPNLCVTYKSFRCWIYQCTEGTVPETELFQCLLEVCNHLAHEIICNLTAYERADGWE